MKLFFLALFFLVCSVEFAMAAACDKVGKLTHDKTLHRMQVCDQTLTWRTVDGGVLAPTCTSAEEGKQILSGAFIIYCDGTNWRSITQCGPLTSSATCPIGTMFFSNKNRLLTCGTSSRFFVSYSNGNCSGSESLIECSEYMNSTMCVQGGCAWASAACKPLNCAGYMGSLACNADPNCSWDNGTTTCLDNF